MNTFEHLPNEILIEIFKNLDIHDLFQAFYNLNLRLNNVLHSTNNLSFTLLTNNYHEFKSFDFSMRQISSLIIASNVNVNLQQFQNIRYLMLLTPTLLLILQLNKHTFPNLEHLIIKYPRSSVPPYAISETIYKIFSNQYPQLQSCQLPGGATVTVRMISTQVLTLRILKVGTLDLPVYEAILTTCPNLYLLQFIKSSSVDTRTSSEPHPNLRRMIVELSIHSTGNQYNINSYLSHVPNLEQLTIHHVRFAFDPKDYLTYDWLSSSITPYLSSLRQFNYYLEIFYFGSSVTSYIEHCLNQINRDFKRVHNGKYQSRLIIVQRS